MKAINSRGLGATLFPVVCGVFAAAISVGALAQGIPIDWSHRHVIFSNPETQEEAAAKGKLDEWNKKANDPRFVLQFERKEARAAAKQASADGTDGVAETSSASDGRLTALSKKKKAPAPSSEIHRDWSYAMGGAAGAGKAGTYPAKYAFGTTNKFCASDTTPDFVVYSSAAGGATGSGNFASQSASFTGNPTNGQTFAITRGSTTVTIVASTSSNTGTNFLIVTGNNTAMATNLASAIARNGAQVGVTATSLGAAVTLTSLTQGASIISITDGLGGIVWTNGTLAGGTGTAGQPTIFALDNLYSGCSGTVPSAYWSYNTGTGAVADLSPVLSGDGTQVAFIQRSGTTAQLVLLKWRAGDGTVGVPFDLTTSAADGAAYRACTAPCQLTLPFNGNPNNTNSSPFVHYDSDTLYVGDAAGKLHKFTGVFSGAPEEHTEAGTNVWPAVVTTTASQLTSPVYDFTNGRVFVGSTRSTAATDTGKLHRVNPTIGSGAGGITSSAQLFQPSMTAPFDSPIVDNSSNKVYVFVGDDAAVAGDQVIYRFDTALSLDVGSQTPEKNLLHDNNGSTANTIYAGAFDDAYYATSGAGGYLYTGGWRGNMHMNRTNVSTFTTTAALPTGSLGGGNVAWSPVTSFRNGSAEYIYASAQAGNVIAGCGAGGCLYMWKVGDWVYDTTSLPSTIDSAADRFINVGTSAVLSTTEGPAQTTVTAAEAGTYSGMVIVQEADSPSGTTFTYTLRRSGTDQTGLQCAIPAGSHSCQDGVAAVAFAAGQTIDVRVARTAGTGNLTTTFRVMLNRAPQWPQDPDAGLPAPGGTGGIIIDNAATGGGSQIYYSIRGTGGIGNAVQASQAALD